jgi:membrane protein implicated in regulation of membrane protease activity
MKEFIVFWKQKTYVSQVLFIIAMLYCVSSVIILLLALGVVRWLPQAYLNPDVLIGFSLISFAFALILSAYHFSTFLNRRKRKEDRDEASYSNSGKNKTA